MARAPRYEALRFAGDGLGDRPDAAAELERVAAHETARQVRFVELLAPQAGRRRTVAVGRLVEAVDLGIGVEHQVPADQPAGIGEPVREPPRGRIPWPPESIPFPCRTRT